jgi:hypothetical protein
MLGSRAETRFLTHLKMDCPHDGRRHPMAGDLSIAGARNVLRNLITEIM